MSVSALKKAHTAIFIACGVNTAINFPGNQGSRITAHRGYSSSGFRQGLLFASVQIYSSVLLVSLFSCLLFLKDGSKRET